MAVRDVDRDVFGREAGGGQLIHRVVVRFLDAQRNRGVHALGMHVLDELEVVEVEAVHHVEVTVLRQPGADGLVDHRFHVGRHRRNAEAAAAEGDAGIALRTAFHHAFAREQEDVVVVENLHKTKLL
jgi:hypothetical protein